MTLSNFQFILILAVVAFIFPFVGVFVAWLLRPKKPNPIKTSTYECGMETYGDAWSQFKAQYYLYALIFVIFDIEAVFLFPWAVAYNRLPIFSLVVVGTFVLILLESLIYAWRTRALEWS
jgi:NADH-quinone oxidoreductase subunit A